MKKFLFGVLVGIVLAVFFEAKGQDLLKEMGLDPAPLLHRIETLQGEIIGMVG
ncbi:MAG: hypothetical protein AB1640_11405 [bacterium]